MAQKSRNTIGTNPLDAVVPHLINARGATPTNNDAPSSSETVSSTVSSENQREARRKERLTIHLSNDLIERVKNAVFWTPGLTLADLGEAALTRMVDELEEQHGTPFETRSAQLKGGRPLKRS